MGGVAGGCVGEEEEEDEDEEWLAIKSYNLTRTFGVDERYKGRGWQWNEEDGGGWGWAGGWVSGWAVEWLAIKSYNLQHTLGNNVWTHSDLDFWSGWRCVDPR